MSENHADHIVDVAIIGAGPAGLFAVFQCGMLGLSCRVIDSLPGLGGQCTALYPEKPIYDIPGFHSVAAGDLIEKLEAQAEPFNPVYTLGQQVTGMAADPATGIWTLTTSADERVQARTVLIAAGGGAFGPNRPPLHDIESFETHSVFYLVRHRSALWGKNVVIAGGGDSAVDWAISLSDVAKSIYLVHRRDHFRAAPGSVTRMRTLVESGKINLMVPYQLKGLRGDKGVLSSVIVAHSDNNEECEIEANILLPFFGLATTLGPISSWGVNVQSNHIVVDPATAETNLPGVYAIGDIAIYKNKLKLILTGFAEAAQAAHAIYHRIHPGQELHMEYSTTKGPPGQFAA